MLMQMPCPAYPADSVAGMNPRRVKQRLAWTLVFNLKERKLMDDIEIVLSKDFQPTGNLSLRVPEVAEPFQGVVVCSGNERTTKQVWAEVTDTPNQCKQFSPSCTVPPLSFCQCSACICNDLLTAINFLGEDCPRPFPLASTSRMKSWLKFGSIKTGAELK